MKQGLSLVDMAHTLEANRKVARDFVADSRKLALSADAQQLIIEGQGSYELQPHAERQLAEKLQVPVPFYQRLQAKHPDLLAGMVNTLFAREPAPHMVRTLPGVARAVLSNGYRPLDNYDLFDAIYPVLKEAGATVESCNITDTKFYLKVLMPWLDRELPVPEGLKMGEGHNWFIRRIQGAATFSNSEVGHGGLSILPGIFEKQCTNLATFKTDGIVRVHLGKKTQADDIVREYMSDATRKLDDAAFWSTVRDHAKAIMDGRVFEAIIGKMAAARADVIDVDAVEVVELFSKQQSLTQEESGGLLRHLVGSGEMTRYGLNWAITRLSQDVVDYDRASELERLGGKVIEMGQAEWRGLLEAA
jgi:hypothetical protein